VPKKIEIVSRWDSSKVLYVAKGAADVRAALEEAVASGADLRGADLRDANLRDANLRGADLRDADLRGAYLRDANLRDAYLRDAYLRGAYLRDANLRGAYLRERHIDDPAHPLWQFRQDYWSILDQAPAEVAQLRKQIKAGKINGSVYEDDCGLGCLNGTIAKAHGCEIGDLREELGIVVDSNRPAEQWFIAITKGDKPLPLDTDFTEHSESEFRISHALVWLEEWVEIRKAICKALAPKKRKAVKPKAGA
jgi:hypothetical protein